MPIVNQIYNKDDECPICFESMQNTIVSSTPCNHVFHKSCLKQQFSSNQFNSFACSICRYSLWEHMSPSEQRSYDNNIDEVDDDTWSSDMIDIFDAYLHGTNNFFRSQIQSPRPTRQNRQINFN